MTTLDISRMKKHTWYLLFCVLGMGVMSCADTKMQYIDDSLPLDPNAPVTFERNIKKLIVEKCSPCHLQGGDRNNKWDNYTNLKTQITGVMGRVRKTPNDPLFMPKNGTKLTEEELNLLTRWIEGGLPER